jgi:general secretion pathway protein I
MAEFIMLKAMRPKTSPHKGFTLLEIMIALAIVSIAMVSLLALANRSIGVHDRLQRITTATLLAQQKMAETEVNARNGSLQDTASEGVFTGPYAAYRWQIAYADTPLPSVQMVTVTVLWGDVERNELVDLASFIF